MRKKLIARRVILYEMVAFSLILALIWPDEIADIQHLILGAEPTPVNWQEALLESLLIAPVIRAKNYYT
jgi:hypothetical protein